MSFCHSLIKVWIHPQVYAFQGDDFTTLTELPSFYDTQNMRQISFLQFFIICSLTFTVVVRRNGTFVKIRARAYIRQFILLNFFNLRFVSSTKPMNHHTNFKYQHFPSFVHVSKSCPLCYSLLKIANLVSDGQGRLSIISDYVWIVFSTLMLCMHVGCKLYMIFNV